MDKRAKNFSVSLSFFLCGQVKIFLFYKRLKKVNRNASKDMICWYLREPALIGVCKSRNESNESFPLYS